MRRKLTTNVETVVVMVMKMIQRMIFVGRITKMTKDDHVPDHIARTERMRKPEGKSLLGKSRYEWEREMLKLVLLE
jgi:hypothetical protein